MDNNTSTSQSEYGEVLDTKRVFFQILKKKNRKAIWGILFSLSWSFSCVLFLPREIALSDFGIYLTAAPWFLFLIWLITVYSKIREAFWKQLALKYSWEYTSLKEISGEKALLFKEGHFRRTQHGITGLYNNQPFHIFEYEYTIGSGKSQRTYRFTVFEIKFTGTFPHLYLSYKSDWYSNSPSIFSSLAKISVPSEFEDKFRLYAPKEYEIETLEIFTPNIFALLIDLKWNHDMEFVDSELVIYSKKRFNNFADLNAELNKIKKFKIYRHPISAVKQTKNYSDRRYLIFAKIVLILRVINTRAGAIILNILILMNMKLIVLSAGKGTRFLPITNKTPKGMIPILKEPLLKHVVEPYLPYVSDIIFVINNPLGKQIKDYFKKSYLGHKIFYKIQKEQKGTMDALMACKDLIKENELFCVVNGDDLLKEPDIKNALKEGVIGTGVSKKTMPKGYLGINIENENILGFTRHDTDEKYVVNMFYNGFNVLDKKVFEFQPIPTGYGEFGLPHTLFANLDTYPLKAFIFKSWETVNKPLDIEPAAKFIQNG